jgi:tetratricopeptide (TPR) repeat protein
MAQLTIQQAFDLALQHHQAGRLRQAEQLYRQILARKPEHADAMHLLGALAHQVGRNDVAVGLIHRAIALNPNNAKAHNNLGNVLKDKGQLDEAIAAFRQAIALNPNLPEAHNNLGSVLKDKGQLDEAIAACRQAIALKPNYPEAHNNLGVALKDKGQLDDAIAAYRQAIALNPNFPEVHNNLGIALKDKGRLDEAVAAFRQAIALNPNFPEAHSNFGDVLRDTGQLDEALAACRRAIALRPNYSEAHSNLGNALSEKGQLDEAITAFRQAIALNPNLPEAHNNLGGALKDKGQFDEALVAFRQAIALNPNLPEAHINLSLVLLSLGHFAEGWEEFESRLQLPRLHLNRGFSQPQWDGRDPAGKTILLFTEGGFGDALHFIRLVPQATARGGRWFLECQPELVTLFDKTPGIERIIPRGQPLPEFDMQIPLQGLPRVLKITLENIPNEVPYLNPPADRVERWAAKLAGETRLRVGLAWAGSKGTKGDTRTRSLDVFAPLASVAGVKFFSLQKGESYEQSPPAGMEWADFTGEMSDFADAAALVRNLDLVVTVDTSIAHLAGALARPVWVLIPFLADFRWLHKRTDSPWYPSMRLFRQETFGDWPTVISRIVESLAAVAVEKMTRPRNQAAFDAHK